MFRFFVIKSTVIERGRFNGCAVETTDDERTVAELHGFHVEIMINIALKCTVIKMQFGEIFRIDRCLIHLCKLNI